MKILHVVEPFATGVLSFIQELSNYQINIGHDVIIAYGVRDGTPNNVREMFDPRIRMIRVKSFNGALKSLINPRSYLEIRGIYHDVNPDVVHLHSSASGFIGRIVIPCKSTRVFYTPHGYSFLSDNTPFILKKIYWVIEKVASMFKSTTIACSYREFQDAKKISSRSTYVNNGVNVKALVKDIKQINLSGQITVCTSGRIIHQKGPIFFNEIARKLPNINFIWIGEGEMQDELDSPNIKVTGWMKREDTLALVGSSTFFILTSYGEGLSVSLLEAMCLKRICIVRNVRGCRDIIRDKDNGFLCETPDDFVNTIKSVVAGKLNGLTCAESAYNDILSQYNSEFMAKKYCEIYQK